MPAEWDAANARRIYHERRGAFLADKFCVECASRERLEIDHIDPATKITHNVWSRTKVFRDAELAKCQVLCHDCHLEKTRGEVPHQTTAMYNRGCRCTDCRSAQAAYVRSYRLRNPRRRRIVRRATSV